MKKFNKMIAVLMSVTMIVCMFSVPTSAATVYDKAVKLSPMELVSQKEVNVDKDFYYKIVLSDSGTVTFRCEDQSTGGYAEIMLLDGDGNTVMNTSYNLNNSCKVEKKGTYFIKIHLEYVWSGGHFTDFYYTFKPDNTPSISIAMTMKVGEKLDLSAITSNYKGNVTWKTTKSSVATVSKGTVTAKKKGTAQIRAYMNNGDYAEITVKVTK